MRLKHWYGRRCNVCCERKVGRNNRYVGLRWGVLVRGSVGLVGGSVKCYGGRRV